MKSLVAVIFLIPVVLFGFYFLFSCAAEYGPSNDWRGLVRSLRFWGGLVLSFGGTAMLLSAANPFCGLF